MSRTKTVPIVAVLALAATAYLVYGHGYPNVDAAYSLMWGRDLFHGQLPDYAGGPTPHPLSNALSLLLAPLGAASDEALLILSYLSAGLLVYVTWLTADRLAGALAGVVAALLVFSRATVSISTPVAALDVPYAALVVGAIAMEVGRPRCGRAVLVALAVAGLLRPEAWLIAGMYWLWMLPAVSRGEAVRLAALVATAPVMWMAADLAVTGNPIWGFTHHTEAASRVAGGSSGVKALLTEAPRLLGGAITKTVTAVAVVGVALVLLARREEGIRAAASGAVVTLAWAIPVAAGTLALVRYALPTVAMACVFAGVAVGGWLRAERMRAVVVGAAVLSALLLLAGVPSQVDGVRASRETMLRIADSRNELEEVVRTTAFPCRRVVVPNGRLVPLISVWQDIDSDKVLDRRWYASANPRGVYVYGSSTAMDGLVRSAVRDKGKAPLRPPPSDAPKIATSDGWWLADGCSL